MLIIPTPMAEIAANMLRSYALIMFPSWRPFAFRFPGRSSVVSSDKLVDKPYDLYLQLSMYNYEYGARTPDIGTIAEEIYNVSGSFTIDDIRAQSRFSITGVSSNNRVLCRVVEPITLSVYYRYDCGLFDQTANHKIIPVSESTVVFASRHRVVNDISFSIEELDPRMSRIAFRGCDEEFLKEVVKGASNMLVWQQKV